jgi:hypothetical protein
VKTTITSLFLLLLSYSYSPAQESRIQLFSLYSSVFSTQKNFNILLPPGYDNSTERYPVVVLLRGHEREWGNVTEDGSRRGNIKTVYDSLLLRGRIGKMILLMPAIGGPPSDQDFRHITLEVLPYVDKYFRTLPTRWMRGVDGFSYGGLGMMDWVTIYPTAVASAGGYDGTYSAFDYGRIRNGGQVLVNEMRKIRFMLHCAAFGPNNQQNNRAMVDTLAKFGIPNEFSELPLRSDAQHNWYFADIHMSITLPLHWDAFLHARNNLQVAVPMPQAGTKISGNREIHWTVSSTTTPIRIFIEYSGDDGRNWKALCSSSAVDSVLTWNTATVSDGTMYKLRVTAAGDTVYGSILSSQFTIDNPGNAPPSVTLTPIPYNSIVKGIQNISWSAADPEGDPVTVSLEMRQDSRSVWIPITSGLANTGTYNWNSERSPNSTNADLRIRCSDGTLTTSDSTLSIIIANARRTLSSLAVSHVSGNGNGPFIIHLTNEATLKQGRYRAMFELQGADTTYTIIDASTKTPLATKERILGPGNEGPEFDGVRLEIKNYSSPIPAFDCSRWLNGSSTLLPVIFIPRFQYGGEDIQGIPFAADYEILISDHIVDTSSSMYGSASIPMKFSVRNTTKTKPVKIIFNDMNGDAALSENDEIIIIDQGPSGPAIGWDLQFLSSSSLLVLPQPGDVFLLKILKPYTVLDTLEFITSPNLYVKKTGTAPLSFTVHQNYPNPFNGITNYEFEITNEELIRIKVFDLLGRELATVLNERLKPGTHRIQWNSGNLPSGVYFYRLEMGNVTAVKKMILLR